MFFQNIYPSSQKVFWFEPLTPSEIPVQSALSLKFLAFEIHTPLEFPMILHGVGMDIFCNRTIKILINIIYCCFNLILISVIMLWFEILNLEFHTFQMIYNVKRK